MTGLGEGFSEGHESERAYRGGAEGGSSHIHSERTEINGNTHIYADVVLGRGLRLGMGMEYTSYKQCPCSWSMLRWCSRQVYER